MSVSKKSIFQLLILSLSLIQISCSSTDNSEIQSISHGKSFGMCEGYCFTEEIYHPNQQILHIKSNRVEYPEKYDTLSFSKEKWTQLLATFELEDFKKLPKIIGCPDCADGGAEWISIKTVDKTYKVTFEYQKEVKGMNKLLQLVRTN